MSCDRLDSIRVDQIVTSGRGIEIASPNQITDYIMLAVRYQRKRPMIFEPKYLEVVKIAEKLAASPCPELRG